MEEHSIVFVIDNDHSSRIGLTSLLRTAGYHVRGYTYVSEFLDVLNPDTSGCIILDARMHGLSGTELLLELKFRHVHLPIIVVASDDDTETKRNAEKIKAIAFLRKPVDGTALIDVVNWALRERNLENSKTPEDAKH